MAKPLAERFSEKVSPEPNTGCWLWTGATIKGYGAIQLGRRGEGVAYAHRVAYELNVGPVPDGLLVLHRCDNGAIGCVNPAHLFLGTNATNMADKVAKGRQPRGSAMPYAKLTETTVAEVRSLFSTGRYTKRVLAHRFHIDESHLRRILNGEAWGHVAA